MDLRVRTAIEIKNYGDFDIPVTNCIMVSPDVRNTKDLLKTFSIYRGLPNPDGSGLPTNMLEDTTEDFIKYLKKEGFKKLNTTDVIFSD